MAKQTNLSQLKHIVRQCCVIYAPTAIISTFRMKSR